MCECNTGHDFWEFVWFEKRNNPEMEALAVNQLGEVSDHRQGRIQDFGKGGWRSSEGEAGALLGWSGGMPPP